MTNASNFTDNGQEAVFPLVKSGPVVLYIDVQPGGYQFSYDNGGGRHSIGYLASALLVRTRSFDSIMTGTHLALFASGTDNQGSLRPAHFRNVSWEGTRAGGQ
jgi:hypothetical protein